MAAKTTVKVSLTNNASKDDSFSGDDYSWLSEEGSLKGSLNVLGNDPGSAKLVGVSDTIPTSAGDLTAQSDSISVTFNGQPYTIKLTANSDGTVGFDASALAGNLNYLAEGQSETVTFYYTAQMANGAYSTAKVSIEITGENDPPTLAAIEPIVFIDTNINDPLEAFTGQLVGNDVDSDALLTYGFADPNETGESAYGKLTLNADGSFTFEPDDDAINALKDTAEVTFTVKVTDNHNASAEQTITIQLNGANDDADITGDNSGSVTEDGTLIASGDLNSTDRDTEDADDAWATGNQSGVYGTFSMAADGQWTYTLNNGSSALDDLDAGQTFDETFDVFTADGTKTTVTVTVNGADEAPADPTIAAPVADNVIGDPNDFDNYTTTATTTDWDPTNGADTKVGDGQANTINGGNGADVLLGGAGDDHLIGENENDTIYGQAGNDDINGGSGTDTIYGGSGNDTITGNNGVDTIYGGSGGDTINGSNGDDVIIGGWGRDFVDVSAGNDTIKFIDVKDTGDVITGFGSGDVLDFKALGLAGGAVAGTDVVANGVNYFAEGGDTKIWVDTDGDISTVEMEITLVGANGTLNNGTILLA